MDIKNLILVIIAVLNFLLAVAIFYKNRKSFVNLYFSLMVFVGSLWIFSLFGYSLASDNPVLRLLFLKLIYTFTLIIGFYYFIFCYHFPYKLFKFPKLLSVLIYIFVLFYSLVLVINNNYLFSLEKLLIENLEATYIGNYLTFSIIFVLFIILGFIQLLIKFFKSESITKKLIGYVMVGTFATFILASITNLLPLLWDSFEIFWLGPVFSLINFSMIAYLIFYKAKKSE